MPLRQQQLAVVVINISFLDFLKIEQRSNNIFNIRLSLLIYLLLFVNRGAP